MPAIPNQAEVQFREVVQQSAHQIRKATERQQKVAEFASLHTIYHTAGVLSGAQHERTVELEQELWPTVASRVVVDVADLEAFARTISETLTYVREGAEDVADSELCPPSQFDQLCAAADSLADALLSRIAKART